jgi:hypothetical protein
VLALEPHPQRAIIPVHFIAQDPRRGESAREGARQHRLRQLRLRVERDHLGDPGFAAPRFYSSAVWFGVATARRNRYEQMFTDMVRQFDAGCLERDRITQRLINDRRFADIPAATANLPKEMCNW